jgi:type IV pilus assembly protein PilC
MTTTFAYKVRDKSGKVVSGELEAANSTAVATKLREMGYVPVHISELKQEGLQKEINIPGFGGKVKLKDLAVFSRQFATMINSGLSLLRGLSILQEQTENKKLAEVIGEVRNKVEAGGSLSQAMAEHEKVFPRLYVSMIRAGEAAGTLDAVLQRIAETLEKEVALRQKIKAAMTYPVIVFILAILLTGVMLIFIAIFVYLGVRAADADVVALEDLECVRGTAFTVLEA